MFLLCCIYGFVFLVSIVMAVAVAWPWWLLAAAAIAATVGTLQRDEKQ